MDNPPEDAEYLWRWFWELKKGNQGGFVACIDWQTIAAWQQVKDIWLTPEEADCLRDMDDAHRLAYEDKWEWLDDNGD